MKKAQYQRHTKAIKKYNEYELQRIRSKKVKEIKRRITMQKTIEK